MAETPSLTFRSNFTPAITFNPFSKSDVKQGGGALLDILKPSIDGTLPIVGKVHYAPNGEPSGAGVIVLAVVGFLALFGAYKLIAR